MPDDLFGPKAAIEHYQQVVTPPRRKFGSVSRPKPKPVPVAPKPTLTAEQIEKFRSHSAANFRVWAVEELERWKSKLPAAEYERQRARLLALEAPCRTDD